MPTLPIFPLNTVVFPGVSLPLHVFEERYRSLVRHLEALPDARDRLFGIVAIREGYEVGQHEARSMYRTGCVVQLTDVTPYDDGTYDIEVVGRHRMRVEGIDAGGAFVVAEMTELEDEPGEDVLDAASRALSAFHDYRNLLSEIRGGDVLTGTMPRDPALLSYSLAATALLSLRERQSLIEVSTTHDRLTMLRHLLRQEIRAMHAVPSLPATEVARTTWSPN
ncbi:MAG TPA: LON peptidase substrate-binding domain-containing protein [Nocardioidaceae bacterium]|nr:LON peptidase substrate-binding domain-containing protein [Nocardioidaceae bacterium]